MKNEFEDTLTSIIVIFEDFKQLVKLAFSAIWKVNWPTANALKKLELVAHMKNP